MLCNDPVPRAVATSRKPIRFRFVAPLQHSNRGRRTAALHRYRAARRRRWPASAWRGKRARNRRGPVSVGIDNRTPGVRPRPISRTSNQHFADGHLVEGDPTTDLVVFILNKPVTTHATIVLSDREASASLTIPVSSKFEPLIEAYPSHVAGALRSGSMKAGADLLAHVRNTRRRATHRHRSGAQTRPEHQQHLRDPRGPSRHRRRQAT